MTTAGQFDDGGFGFPIMRKRFLPEQPDQRVDFAFQLCDALIARGKFLVAPRDDERGDGLAQHVVTGVWLRVGRHRRGGGARLCVIIEGPVHEAIRLGFSRQRLARGLALGHPLGILAHELVVLGAQSRDVLRLVFGQTLLTAAIGMGAGVGLAFACGRLLSSFLYGVSPRDPLTFASAILTMTATALVAAALPASRAVRLDPIRALRDV